MNDSRFYDHLNVVFENAVNQEVVVPEQLRAELFGRYNIDDVKFYFYRLVSFIENNNYYFDSIVQAVAYALLQYSGGFYGDFSNTSDDKLFNIDVRNDCYCVQFNYTEPGVNCRFHQLFDAYEWFEDAYNEQ